LGVAQLLAPCAVLLQTHPADLFAQKDVFYLESLVCLQRRLLLSQRRVGLSLSFQEHLLDDRLALATFVNKPIALPPVFSLGDNGPRGYGRVVMEAAG
jgi:hypothetical protein